MAFREIWIQYSGVQIPNNEIGIASGTNITNSGNIIDGNINTYATIIKEQWQDIVFDLGQERYISLIRFYRDTSSANLWHVYCSNNATGPFSGIVWTQRGSDSVTGWREKFVIPLTVSPARYIQAWFFDYNFITPHLPEIQFYEINSMSGYSAASGWITSTSGVAYGDQIMRRLFAPYDTQSDIFIYQNEHITFNFYDTTKLGKIVISGGGSSPRDYWVAFSGLYTNNSFINYINPSGTPNTIYVNCPITRDIMPGGYYGSGGIGAIRITDDYPGYLEFIKCSLYEYYDEASISGIDIAEYEIKANYDTRLDPYNSIKINIKANYVETKNIKNDIRAYFEILYDINFESKVNYDTRLDPYNSIKTNIKLNYIRTEDVENDIRAYFEQRLYINTQIKASYDTRLNPLNSINYFIMARYLEAPRGIENINYCIKAYKLNAKVTPLIIAYTESSGIIGISGQLSNDTLLFWPSEYYYKIIVDEGLFPIYTTSGMLDSCYKEYNYGSGDYATETYRQVELYISGMSGMKTKTDIHIYSSISFSNLWNIDYVGIFPNSGVFISNSSGVNILFSGKINYIQNWNNLRFRKFYYADTENFW